MSNCKFCGVEMPKAQGRGLTKLYCSPEHQEQAKILRPEKPMEKCSIEGCEEMANRRGAKLCEKHYGRIRRNGTTESGYERLPENTLSSTGYVLTKAKEHPRSIGRARAYAHRVVFTDAHGEGPFKCNWCRREVTWANMHVDHLNDVKTDNRIENLVASCGVCNQQRGHEKVVQKHRDKTGIEYKGEKLTPQEWATRLGISNVSLKWRLRNGWSVEKALNTPRGVFGPKSKSS